MKGIYAKGVTCRRCQKYLASDNILDARLKKMGIELPVGSYYYIDNFLRLDRQSDFEINLNFCLDLANKVIKQPQYWKQLVCNFHNLFQAAMVVNFADNEDCVYKEWARKNIVVAHNQLSERYRETGDFSAGFTEEELEMIMDTPLETFLGLYKRCLKRQGRHGQYLTEVRSLNALRNNLVHYDGKLWAISFSRMQETLLNALPALEALLKHQVAASLCWNWDYDERYRDEGAMQHWERIEARKRSFYKKLICLARLLKVPGKHETMFPAPPHLHPPRG
jgi:hypothetical protein